MRISDWSSDVCSSDLASAAAGASVTAPARLPPTPHRAPFTRLVPRLRLSDSAAIQRLSVDRRSQRRVDQPAIDHDRGADDVIAGAAGEVDRGPRHILRDADRSEEHTSELQSLMRISYAVFCLKKKINNK